MVSRRSRAAGEGLEHGAAGDAEDVGGDDAEFDVGVSEELFDPACAPSRAFPADHWSRRAAAG